MLKETIFLIWTDTAWKTSRVSKICEVKNSVNTWLAILREGEFNLNDVTMREIVLIKESTKELVFDRCSIDLMAYELSKEIRSDEEENMIKSKFEVLITNKYEKYLNNFLSNNAWGVISYLYTTKEIMLERMWKRPKDTLSNFDKRLLNEEGLFEVYKIIFDELLNKLEELNMKKAVSERMIILKQDTSATELYN